MQGFVRISWHAVMLATLTSVVIGCGGGGGGTTQPPAPPPPQLITYSIQVSELPSDAATSVGEPAEASVTWSFSASSSNASSTSYTVTSTTSGVQISGGSGSVVPGTSISTSLMYECSAPGSIEAQITLRVGSATESLTWTIACTQEQITFAPLEEVLVEQDEAALTTLTWTFETTGNAGNSFTYEVVVESDRLQITNATGSSLPGSEIEHQLRYMCREIGFHQVALQLRVGSATQRVEWSVTCTVEDILAITAQFHQGPLLEQVEFSLLEDQWQTEVIPLFYAGQRPLRLGSNRQMFVTFAFETERASQIDISLESSNTADDVSIEKVSTSNLVPNLSGTRTNYIRRTVFNVAANDLTTLGMLQIQIDPDDAVPQRNEANNDIVFDIAKLEIVEIPHLRLVLIPIISSEGEPDLTDTSFYVDVLYDLLPIGTYSVDIGEAIDLSSEETFDPNAALNAVFERWLASGDRNEFFHGIFKQPDVVENCGLAHVGGNTGATGEAGEYCSDNTIAHELGHNLSLNHAPACGAENANPDADYPYADGSIGTESGWLMRKQQPIGQAGLTVSKIFDTMAYCLETFTSQYSYGKAYDYFVRRFGTQVAASEPPRRSVAGFELIEGRSLVLMGFHSESEGWVLQKTEFVDKMPFPRSLENSEFQLLLTHTSSGTLVYRDAVRPMVIAHGDPNKRAWGLRIPAFNASGLHVAIVDREENVLFEHEIAEDTN